jgi:hypothetical protein
MAVSVTRKQVLILNLLPLQTPGQGDTFASNVARAALAHGEDVVLAAPVDPVPTQAAHRVRMGFEFITARPGRTEDAPWTVARLAGSDLLDLCATFDYVAVQQFLASDFVFDIIAALDSTQTLVLTSQGHEPLLPIFAAFYQPCANHHVLSVSPAAAARLAAQGVPSRYVHAGEWGDDIDGAAPTLRHTYTLDGYWGRVRHACEGRPA